MSDTTGIIEDDLNVNPNTGEVTEPAQPTDSAGALVVRDAIARMASGNVGVYSTVVGNDFEAKRTTLAAVTSAVPLADHFGEHIELANVVVQEVEISDQTGAKSVQPRVILLDADGTAYYAISPVVLNAVRTFIGILGQPHTWPGPVGVKVTRERAKVGFFYNMTLDSPAKGGKK